MNKLNRKINKFLKKVTDPFTFIAGGLIIAGFISTKAFHISIITTVCYLIAAALCGLPILYRAYTGLKMKAVGIEVLVTIAVIGALFIGEYNEAAVVTFLFQLGTFLETRTLKKTRSAIKMLAEMAPATAWKLDSPASDPEEIDADEVEEGDLLLVKTGGKVAVDGVIEYGEGYLDEASITGESTPLYKVVGHSVYAGTILDSGTIHMRATKVGEDTTFAKIVALVEEAQDARSPIERYIDKFAKWYTPLVVVMAVLVFIFTRNLDTAITVLVLACPGALVIGAPVANVAGIGRGAREQILLKGGDSVTTYAKTNVFVFDKTGTLTVGHPEVTMVHHYSQDSLEALRLTGLVEKNSDHPLGKAVVNYVKNQKIDISEAVISETVKGFGIKANLNGHRIVVGNERLLEAEGIDFSEAAKDIQAVKENGGSVVLAACDREVLLLLGISDKIDDGAKDMLLALKNNGIKKTIMLTGDNEETAQIVARELGIDEVRAQLLPEDKLTEIQKLQAEGNVVAFVGDGVNDSPGLAMADTGIAVGGGTDVAIETSDVVLMRKGLDSIPVSLKLSKHIVGVLWQNIIIAVGTVVLLLMGLLAGYIHMASGMFIHEASILVVILNAMRLLYKNK